MKKLLFTSFLCAFSASSLTLTANALGGSGAVYTMDNAAGANHVLAWKRAESGVLSGPNVYATGGAGAGAGLSSQGSVLLSQDGAWLFVCNAGSAEISVFAASTDGLELTDKAGSGGRMPVSLALNEDLLYVLNAGGGAGDKDNITAFHFADGKLSPVSNSTRALSGDKTGPAQVSFTQDGDALIVTERTTSLIDTFTIGEDGLAANHKVFQSAGVTPFGFAVGRHGRIFVSEAGGSSSPSSASSYSLSERGDLTVLSAAIPTQQAAACWLILSRDGRFAYTANAGSGSISGFSVSPSGVLQLLNADGITASVGSGSHPVDLAISQDGRFFFSLNNGNGTLSAFRTSSSGSLELLMNVNGIAGSAAGLAGR